MNKVLESIYFRKGKLMVFMLLTHFSTRRGSIMARSLLSRDKATSPSSMDRQALTGKLALGTIIMITVTLIYVRRVFFVVSPPSRSHLILTTLWEYTVSPYLTLSIGSSTLSKITHNKTSFTRS